MAVYIQDFVTGWTFFRHWQNNHYCVPRDDLYWKKIKQHVNVLKVKWYGFFLLVFLFLRNCLLFFQLEMANLAQHDFRHSSIVWIINSSTWNDSSLFSIHYLLKTNGVIMIWLLLADKITHCKQYNMTSSITMMYRHPFL